MTNIHTITISALQEINGVLTKNPVRVYVTNENLYIDAKDVKTLIQIEQERTVLLGIKEVIQKARKKIQEAQETKELEYPKPRPFRNDEFLREIGLEHMIESLS